ncbi:hypothetical protein D3C85_1066880 [compost metagenome]
MAVAANGCIDGLGCLVGGAEGRQRVELDGHADRGQLVAGEQRGGAELGDIGQDWHVQCVDEALVGRQVVGCLGEDGVSAGFDVALAALDGSIDAFGLDGVGTGNEEEVRVGLGVGGSLHAIGHLLGGDDFLARTVAAALGADLVLDMGGGSAGLDQVLDGALDIEGAGTEAGVDIHQQRQVAHVGDAAHIGEHVVQGVDAQVRQAQGASGHAATGQVDGLEAGALGQQGVVGVDRADDLQRMFLGDGVAETLARGFQVHDSPRVLDGLASASW